jgi:hypothetical protein
MRNIIIVLSSLMLCSFTACSQKSKQDDKNKFQYHFKILDSIANGTSTNIILNCAESVKFMEKNTGIEATTDGNYFGRFSCAKSDLQKWHEWYEKRNIKKK